MDFGYATIFHILTIKETPSDSGQPFFTVRGTLRKGDIDSGTQLICVDIDMNELDFVVESVDSSAKFMSLVLRPKSADQGSLSVGSFLYG